MTKNETMRLFRKHFKRWVYMVEHYGWRLITVYHDSVEDMPEGTDILSVACAESNFKYLEATIHVNLRNAESEKEKRIEYFVIHELTHLLLSPLQESCESTPLEYTVTSIARILQGLRDATD
jgi:hypothetical protein